MKYLLIILLFTSSFSFGQTKPLKGKPATLEETFLYLDQWFDDTLSYDFMSLPEDVAVGRLHFPFGMWIRNDWGLWKESELKRYFVKHGVVHAETMSSIIFTSYHRHLLHKPVDLEGQVERYRRINSNIKIDTLVDGSIRVSYPELDKEKRTSNEELLRYYPKGDTVRIALYGKKGIFKKNVIFNGLATISGYQEDQLLLTLIELRKSEKIKSEYHVGQEIDARTFSCTLIPPKGWKR